MKATKRKVREAKDTWPYWLLRYVATNNQQSFQEMAGWLEEQLEAKQPGEHEQVMALMRLLDDYQGSGEASPARYAQLQATFGDEDLQELSLEVFRLHDRIASNSDNIAIEDIEQGLKYADELKHDGVTAYFLMLQGQLVYNIEHNIPGAKKINLRGLELTRKCYQDDAAYADQLQKALANSAITSALDGDVAQARTFASDLSNTGGARYLGPLADILLTPTNFSVDYDTTSRQASDYLENGQSMEALEWFIEAERLAKVEHKDKELCGLLGDKAVAFRRLGNNQRAVETYRQAIQLSRKYKDYVNLSRWSQNIALLLMDAGDEAEASAALKEATSAAEQSGNDLQISTVYGNVAKLYANQGDLESANQMLDKALAHTANDSELRNTWLTNKVYLLAALANQLGSQGKYDEARVKVEAALALFNPESDEQFSMAASMHLMLGEIAKASGEPTRMIAEVEQAVTCYKSAGEPEKAHELSEVLKRIL